MFTILLANLLTSSFISTKLEVFLVSLWCACVHRGNGYVDVSKISALFQEQWIQITVKRNQLVKVFHWSYSNQDIYPIQREGHIRDRWKFLAFGFYIIYSIGKTKQMICISMKGVKSKLFHFMTSLVDIAVPPWCSLVHLLVTICVAHRVQCNYLYVNPPRDDKWKMYTHWNILWWVKNWAMS